MEIHYAQPVESVSTLDGGVISVIAVFFAIGGIGYAAATIGNSDIQRGAVTTKKLHKKSVTKNKLHKNSVTSKKVKDG